MEPCVNPNKAVQHGWMELWYQPKVDAQALTMLGAEALLRACHPIVGIVPPKYFIETPDEFRLKTICENSINIAVNDWNLFSVERAPLEIANFAKRHGARIVAEGVATWPDALAIRDLDCDALQGSLFAKPAPPDQFAQSYWADAWQRLDNGPANSRVSFQRYEPQQRSASQ